MTPRYTALVDEKCAAIYGLRDALDRLLHKFVKCVRLAVASDLALGAAIQLSGLLFQHHPRQCQLNWIR